jgi:hypothetical protein
MAASLGFVASGFFALCISGHSSIYFPGIAYLLAAVYWIVGFKYHYDGTGMHALQLRYRKAGLTEMRALMGSRESGSLEVSNHHQSSLIEG